MEYFISNYINVCLSFDEKYVQHAAVTMMSAVSNCSEPIAFYVLDSNPSCISEQSKRKLINTFKGTDTIIKFSSANYSDYENFPVWEVMQNSPKHCQYVPYYRLNLTDILKDLDRVVYMDSDIVVTGDLSKLFDMKLRNDNYIAGVNDMDFEKLSENISTNGYINSGVILFDLKKIREDNLDVLQMCREILFEKKVQLSPCIDQDLINIVFNNHIEFLDISWNAQSVGTGKGFARGFDDQSIPKNIIHFIAHHKPWMFNCKSQYQYLYFKYLAKTPWKIYALKFFLIKIKKFVFEKKNISATDKDIIILGMPLIKRKIENDRKVYTVLGIKVYSY